MEVKKRAEPLTESQKSEILRIYLLKLRTKSIAIIVGCTKAQVDHLIYKENPGTKRRNKVWTMKDLEEIKMLYIEKHYSCNRIAKSMGVPCTHIVDFVRRNGIKVNDWKKLRTSK